jgi:hypothetical protein
MIVQRENDNHMVMLPIANLVNGASARVKLNDKATFKTDINCRKQERGVIVLFCEWLSPLLNRASFVCRVRRHLYRATASTQHE